MEGKMQLSPKPIISLIFRENLMGHIPSLRVFALSLTRSKDNADDLVQDTLLKAWSHSASFSEGTNMKAWLFTILRNTYFSLYRKRAREVQDTDGMYSERIAVAPTQNGILDLADFRIALAKLPENQREVLILVGATGLSYEEAAEVCDIPIGTVKSRVNRARLKLAELLSVHSLDDIGPDRNSGAIINNGFSASLS